MHVCCWSNAKDVLILRKIQLGKYGVVMNVSFKASVHMFLLH